MPSPSSSSKSRESSSKKHSSSSSNSKQKKSDNWTEVTEPEERRRIQNRLAQRKFREKTKEQKEKSERDTRNQELAGRSYMVPASQELPDDDECSGLPWGSISMRHVVSQGQGSSRSRRSVGDDSHHQDVDYARNNDDMYGQYPGYDTQQASSSYQSYGSYDNGSDGAGAGAGFGAGDFFDDGAYYYNTDDFDGSQ